MVELTAANAEEKCNIYEGLTRDEDLRCRNTIRNKAPASHLKKGTRNDNSQLSKKRPHRDCDNGDDKEHQSFHC